MPSVYSLLSQITCLGYICYYQIKYNTVEQELATNPYRPKKESPLFLTE